MLPGEIKPFADSCRRELENTRELLIRLDNNDPSVTSTEIVDAVKMITNLSRAFDRFEACLRDEQATKNRYEAERRDARLQKLREQ